jgi:hypothetical protein
MFREFYIVGNKKGEPMKKLLYVLILSLLILVVTCQKGPENEAQVEVIDGITHIHNTDVPLYPKRAVVFEEELSIGGDDDAGNIILYQPGRYAVNDKGDIYISDRQELVIKKFNPEGHHMQTIGAKGEGPGEFQAIGSIATIPDGRLIVMDWRARRTSIFDADGIFKKSYKWRQSHLDLYLVTESAYTIQEPHYVERQLFVKTFDFDGNERVSFGQFTPPGNKVVIQGDSAFSIGLPYAPASIFAGDPARQWLYHCLNDSYLIEVFNNEGKIIRKIDRPYKPVPFTDKDAQEYLERFEEDSESPFAKMAREVDMPSVKTVTERMLVDEEGRLWVETHEEQELDNRTLIAYDVFNSEGYYESRFWSDIRPGLFAHGKMYHMKTDEDTGYRSLKRFRIIWKDEIE